MPPKKKKAKASASTGMAAAKSPEANLPRQPGRKKKPSPLTKHEPIRRQETKKQITARIDTGLIAQFMPLAEERGLTLTDTLEEGLWLWLRDNERRSPLTNVQTQLRVLMREQDNHQQKLTLGYVVFMSRPRTTELHELFRLHLQRFFYAFCDDPEFQADLKRLLTPANPGL